MAPHRITASALDVEVRFGDKRYRYLAGSGEVTWDALLISLSELQADRLLLVSARSVPAPLVNSVAARARAVAPVSILTFEGGEREKTVATLDGLARAALEQGATRRTCILAVGGGLTGNIAGLLAALLFRGVRLVQIPTTLLAMSDSVLSLKQAVNSQVGKNHVGTFHAPQFVWSNVDFLESLPILERKSALCEIVKNVLAVRPADWTEVAALLRPDGDYSHHEYLRLIELAIEQKTEVMRDDPFEKRGAIALEYGHTIGHALEVTMGGALTHGLAIGVGMVVAAHVAARWGVAPVAAEQAHRELLARLGAPTVVPASVDVDELMEGVRRDNKRGYLIPDRDMVDMVLLRGLGEPIWTGDFPLVQAPAHLVREAVRECSSASDTSTRQQVSGSRAA